MAASPFRRRPTVVRTYGSGRGTPVPAPAPAAAAPAPLGEGHPNPRLLSAYAPARQTSHRSSRNGQNSPHSSSSSDDDSSDPSERVAIGSGATENGGEPSPPAKRRRLASAARDAATAIHPAVPVSPSPSGRARRTPPRKGPAPRNDSTALVGEDVPAPSNHVPLSERIRKAAAAGGPSAPPSGPQPEPPQLRRTRSSSRLSAASPPSSPPAVTSAPSPRPPARSVRPASPLRRSTTSAAVLPVRVSSSPLRRTASSSSAVAGPASPSKATADPSTLRGLPPSPAKDLSAIFSRFAPSAAVAAHHSGGAGTGSHPRETTAAMKPRTMVKRSHTTTDALVGVAGATTTARGSGADPDDRPEGTNHPGGMPVSPSPSPRRRGLDRRTLSQPALLPASPSPSALPGSPTRPALAPARTLPTLASPLRNPGGEEWMSFSREGSPSLAARPSRRESSGPSSRPGPALGSAYRPVPFTAAVGAGTGFGNGSRTGTAGPTRTYAGGARTLRRDPDEDALFTVPSPDVSAAGPSSSTFSALPPVLPNLGPTHSTQRGRGSPSARPRLAPTASQDLSALRTAWGIDAEDALADSEAIDSQDRGARVVGGDLLRKQGEGKRWMDEMGWCLEGLREGDRSAARASALDLLTKLLSRDWLRRLKSSGQAETVYLALRLACPPPAEATRDRLSVPAREPDRVLDTALAAVLALLVQDQRLAEPLFRLSSAEVARAAAEQQHRRSSPQPASTGPEDDESAGGGGWWSSSPPRKPAADDGPASGDRDEDQCDVLQVLRELGERGYADEPLAVVPQAGEAGGSGRGKAHKKVLRGDARQLQALSDVIASAGLLPIGEGSLAPTAPATLRTLVLAAVRSIASFVPRAIFQPQHLLCDSGVFAQVAWAFVNECSGIPSRMAKFETGLDLLPPLEVGVKPAVSLTTLMTCLGIFESTSLATPYAYHVISDPTLRPRLVQALGDLLLLTFLLALDGPSEPAPPSSTADEGVRTEAFAALTAVLGVLFGLTTECAWGTAFVGGGGGGDGDGEAGTGRVNTLMRIVLTCRRLGSAEDPADGAGSVPTTTTRAKTSLYDGEGQGAELVDEEPEEREIGGDHPSSGSNVRAHALWDILSLALGVLANLAESAGAEFRTCLRNLRLDPSCSGHRKCARQCCCNTAEETDGHSSALEVLAQLALDPLRDAPNSIYLHSVTGFLRLLLGLAILDSPQNEEVVLATLATAPLALAPILDTLEELASLHEDQRRVQAELALPAPVDPTTEADPEQTDLGDSQRTVLDDGDGGSFEVVETDSDEGGMDKVDAYAGEEEEEALPLRMRELVQRLRRRIA